MHMSIELLMGKIDSLPNLFLCCSKSSLPVLEIVGL